MGVSHSLIRLLYVDDDLELADDVSQFLTSADDRISVDTATSASEGLNRFAENHYDCVVSAYDMPGLNGIEFLKTIREDDTDLPFILYTDMGSEEVASNAISAGVTDYLQKNTCTSQFEGLANRIHNVVEVRRAGEAVRETEEWTSTLLEYSSDFLFIVDENGIISYVSPSVERVLGFHPEEITGTTAFEFVYSEDVELATETFAELLEIPDEDFVIEIRARHANGDINWLEVRGRNLLHNPIIEGFLVNARDITDRKSRESELNRFKQAANRAGHAVYITDSEGMIEYVNPAFERLTGYTAEESVGRSPRIINSGVMDEEYYESLWEAILAGDRWEEDIINRRKSGGLYTAHQTIAPISGENDEIAGFVAIQTDITNHKDRIQHLRVLDRILRHNLHNDMNVVRGYAELIQEQAEGRFAKYATQIVQHSDHLLELTDKQRDITEVLSTEPQFDSFDAVAVVRQIVETVSNEYPAASIDLDLPESATVNATTGLDKALEELVHNAIKHSDQETPEATIQISENSTSVHIRILDTGPGIPEMERQVVMGEHEIEPTYHGNGLGLWLVSWIVRRCKGKLTLTENEPRGTVAEITLYKVPSAPTEAALAQDGDRRGL